MIFKDRKHAAKLLLKEIESGDIVVSLLRGGVVVGDVIAKKFSIPHLGLVVAKIPAPHQEELAIGALCFDVTYLEKDVVKTLNLSRGEIREQIKIAQEKFNDYCERFGIVEEIFNKLKNKKVILTDDGIATGATARAALLFIKSKRPKEVILAAPIAPIDFNTRGFDQTVILKQELGFGAVSQFYESFPQIEDPEVTRLLRVRRQRQ